MDFETIRPTLKKILETIEVVDARVAAEKCQGYHAAWDICTTTPWGGRTGQIYYGSLDAVHVVVDQDAMSVYAPDGSEWHNTNTGRYLKMDVVPGRGELMVFADQEFDGFTEDGTPIA